MSADTLGCGPTLGLALAFAGLAWVGWPGLWGIPLAALAASVLLFGIGAFSQNWNLVEMLVIAAILVLVWVWVTGAVWWHLRGIA